MRHFAPVELLCGLEIDAKHTRGFITRYLCSFDGKGYFIHHTGAQKCIYICHLWEASYKGAGSFHIHRKTMKELGTLAVLGVREQPNLAQNLVTHRH